MVKTREDEIQEIVEQEVAALNRPDLFRKPLVAFSRAKDERYLELKQIIGPWHLTPRELLEDAQSVISYFVPFTKTIIADPKKFEDGSPLWSEAYAVINSYFNQINERISQFLTESGYASKTIRATHNYDPKNMQSIWSHRSAAVIAGLGTLGANGLVITEKGSGGRFCTVITSAPLQGEKKSVQERCLYVKNGSCGLCFRICPVKALAPNATDKFACQEELFKNEKILKESTALSSADTCGKCISVCPVAYLE